MGDDRVELLREYTRALESFLLGSGEPALQRAYELSRTAIAEGGGALDLVQAHHDTLRRSIDRAGTAEERDRIVRAAETFLAESLSPFEMTHRGYRDTNLALRRLNDRLEDEAKRIAHALHDEAGQLLVTVHLALADLAADVAPELRDRIAKIRKLLDGVEEQIRRLSHELRPAILDHLGLVPALEFLAEGVTARTGLSVIVRGSLGDRLPPTVEAALYRIAQEGLANVNRHADAGRASVTVSRERGSVACVIQDDGKGFEPAARSEGSGGGLGLLGIRDRLAALGGTLQIHSVPGKGTELRITIPVEE